MSTHSYYSIIIFRTIKNLSQKNYYYIIIREIRLENELKLLEEKEKEKASEMVRARQSFKQTWGDFHGETKPIIKKTPIALEIWLSLKVKKI